MPTNTHKPFLEFMRSMKEALPNSIHCLGFLAEAEGNLQLARRIAKESPSICNMLTDQDWREAVADARAQGLMVAVNYVEPNRIETLDMDGTGFDYERQSWIVRYRYVRCGHPDTMDCRCYGKEHAGELVARA